MTFYSATSHASALVNPSIIAFTNDRNPSGPDIASFICTEVLLLRIHGINVILDRVY